MASAAKISGKRKLQDGLKKFRIGHKTARRFKQLVKSITGSSGWMLAGLRGGGATDFYLWTMGVMSLRRRGRWAQLSTVDRYVQEAAACQQDDKMSPAERSKVAELARLGAAIISTMEFPTPLCPSQL